jgi:hypothetical protein
MAGACDIARRPFRLSGQAAIALIVVLAAPAQGASPLIGKWAGEGVAFRAGADHATIQSGCSSGRSDRPVTLDAAGTFRLKGYYNPPRSGYRLSDIAPRDRPAVFTGKVIGNTMDLEITAANSKPIRHTLHKNQPIKFPRCR